MRKSLTHIAKIILLSVTLATVLLFSVNASAENATRANAATSYYGSGLKDVMPGDSYVVSYGQFAKISLYIATTNDQNEGLAVGSDGYINMQNTLASRRNDGKPMFVKFGKSIIVTAGDSLRTAPYVNLETSKYDTLIDFKKGEKRYPVYNESTKITNAELSNVGVPAWRYNQNGNGINNFAEVVKFFTGNNNPTTASNVLQNIIIEVAKKSDKSGATGLSAVNNVLYTTKQKTAFLYKDKNGQPKDLSVNNILPERSDYLVNWLIVYEPVQYYFQDPNKMFYPSSGGKTFLMTVSDAVLANMNSGASGYPSIVKFMAGTPTVKIYYNHCPLCRYTWFGYSDWPHSNFALASQCPWPCSGGLNQYFGPFTENRYPFGVGQAFRAMARMYTVDKNWLAYSGGYLVNKPPRSIDSLISSNSDVDNMLLYGGYSMFVNGPKMTKSEELKTIIFAKTVVMDEDGNLISVPGFTFTLTPTKTSGIDYDTYLQDTILKMITEKNIPAAQKEAVLRLADQVYGENFLIYVETKEDYTPIFVATDDKKFDLSEMFVHFKFRIDNANGFVAPKEQTHFDLSEMLTSEKTTAENLAELMNALPYVKNPDPDWTITLPDGRKLGTKERYSVNWNRFVVYASNKGINDMMDTNDMRSVYIYDYESERKMLGAGTLPESFEFNGQPIYLTIILPIVEMEIETVGTGDIKENELMKAIKFTKGNNAIISQVVVKKDSSVKETLCRGIVPCDHIDKETGKKQHSWDSCGHSSQSLENAYNIALKSITIQQDWYWNKNMFGSMSKLAALRPVDGSFSNDGVTFVFNKTGSFDSDNMYDAFEKLTEYRLVVHRNANNQPLELAAYMNDTALNKNFLNFMKKYYGTYPSKYSNPGGNFNSDKITIQTTTTLPQNNITAVGSASFCFGGSSDKINIPVTMTGTINSGAGSITNNEFKTFATVRVSRTVSSTNKATNPFATTKQYYGVDPDDGISPMYLIQVQSDPIKFNPAFKMKYQDSNNPDGPFKEVWVLAKGEKTFISNDFVKIELMNSDVNVSAPWSRDREDRVDENGNMRTIPTAKSGSAIRAEVGSTTLKIDVFYHIQDPAFVDPSQRAAVQSQNDAKAQQFDNMVESIASAFRNGGVSIYSNMFQSTTSNTVHRLSSPINFEDLSEKTTLKLDSPINTSIASQTRAYYIDVNGVADYTTSSRKITINGNSISVTERWKDISAVRSENVLKNLLEQNLGYNIPGWYNEDYEGIVLVHKTFIITIDAFNSKYAQIHPQHSDFRTERNKLAKELRFAYGSDVLIPEKQYGIGVEYRLPALTINGETFDNIVIPSKPYLFDIRGAIYDTK